MQFLLAFGHPTSCHPASCHPASCVLHPPLPVYLEAFLEAFRVVVSHLQVPAPVFGAAGPSPEVVALAADPGVVSVKDLEASDIAALFVAGLEAFEPGVVFVVAVSAVDIPEPPASADIRVPFGSLLPVSFAVVEVDSPARPSSVAFPNVYYSATPASSAGVGSDRFAHNTRGAHTRHALCNALSIPDLYHNKNAERLDSRPSRGHSSVTDTNDRAMDATTSHSRKTSLSRYQEQRTRNRCRAALSPREVLETERVAVDRC